MTFDSPRDLLRKGAAGRGDHIAAMSTNERLTYRRLADRVVALAEVLEQAGVRSGIQVAVMLPNSIGFVEWYFGVLQTGGVVVPIDPEMKITAIEEILNRSGVHFLVAGADMALPRGLELTPATQSSAGAGSALWRVAQQYPVLETTPWTPDGVLIRQFSSGSTGRPKHILRTEKNLVADLQHCCRTFGLTGPESYMSAKPFFHSAGLRSFNAAFYLGGKVTVLRRFLPGAVLETARRDRPTIFETTPPMIEAMASCHLEDGDETAFESLKFCICGTGPLSAKAHDDFLKRFGVPVCATYGATELLQAAVDIDDGYQEGRVGRPHLGVEIGIYDDEDGPLPTGEIGWIGVRSEAACDLYVGDPEMSARVFRNGRVFLGDRGYLDDLGRLHLLGRSDIINIGGYKVDPLEVERVIRDGLPVTSVVVLKGERAGLPVVRAVVEADPARVTPSDVVELCRSHLLSYKVPALIKVQAKLPRDANGKVLRTLIDD